MELYFNQRYKPCGLISDIKYINSILQAFYACNTISIFKDKTYDNRRLFKRSIIENFEKKKIEDLKSLNIIIAKFKEEISFESLENKDIALILQCMNEKQQYYERGPYPEGNLYTREILEMFFNILEQLDKSVGCDLSINFFVQKLRNLYTDEYTRILQKFNFSEDTNKDSIFLEYMLGLFNYAYDVKLLKKNDVTDSRFFFTFDFSTNILVIPELNDTELVIFDNCENKKPFLQIKINDTDFCLQAILIKSDDKFICITVEGRFEDKKVYYGRKYLDFFCENGFDIDPYELKPIQRYSSFFFYERLEKLIEFSERYLSNFSSLGIDFTSLHKFWKRPIFPISFIQPYNETRFSKFYIELDILIPEFSFVFTLNGLDSLEYIDCLISDCLISETQEKSVNAQIIALLNILKLKLLKLIREYLREDIMLYSEISGIFLDNVEYHNGELKTRTQFLVEESCIIDHTERNNFLIELLNQIRVNLYSLIVTRSNMFEIYYDN